MKIVLASNNKNKLKEIRTTLGSQFEILSLEDINCFDELPETQDTLKGNSLQKAEYIYNKYKLNCIADDTGLLVDSLNGEPGVYSARYAGQDCTSEDNMTLLLSNLGDKKNRSAHFKTIVTLILDGKTHQFEGKVNGVIRSEKSGQGGFGYDPIFEPEGYAITFSEMSLDEKNKISHRGLAVKKLETFLKAL